MASAFFEAKRHDCVMEIAHGSQKEFFQVRRVHLDLIVATEAIHKGERGIDSDGVDQHIYVGVGGS